VINRRKEKKSVMVVKKNMGICKRKKGGKKKEAGGKGEEGQTEGGKAIKVQNSLFSSKKKGLEGSFRHKRGQKENGGEEGKTRQRGTMN